MTTKKRSSGSSSRASGDDDELGLGDDPLAGADPLVEHFYKPAASLPPRSASARAAAAARGKGRQPLADGRTWRLVTFSFYEDDVVRLDALLEEAKKKGHKRVSRSQIVRLALRHVNIDDLPDVI